MKKLIGNVISFTGGALVASTINKKKEGVKLNNIEEKVDKFKQYYNVLLQWLELKQDNISLEKYFLDNNYKKIAIYGMGELGLRLAKELEGSVIEIVYAIDKKGVSAFGDINLKEIDDELEMVDAIIVTPVNYYDSIKLELESRINTDIVSLETVVFEA